MSQQQDTLNNLLIEAVRNRDVVQAKLYVQKGADPNCMTSGIFYSVRQSMASSTSQNVFGPVLHLAATVGQNSGGFSADMTDFLLGAGARIDAKNDAGDTVLMIGIKTYSERMVNYWLSRGADTMVADKKGDIAITLASRIDRDSNVRQNIINAVMAKMPDQQPQNSASSKAAAAPVASAQADIEVMKPAAVIARRPQKPRGGGGFAL